MKVVLDVNGGFSTGMNEAIFASMLTLSLSKKYSI